MALGHDHDTDTNASEICVLCLSVQQFDNSLPMSTFGLPVNTSLCLCLLIRNGNNLLQ